MASLKVSDTAVVAIESLDSEGRGIARVEGKVLFVDGGLPGETVRAQTTRRKPKYETARVLEVIRESSQRVVPGCPHFGLHAGACGGCSMQHLHPAAQVAIKQRALEDALWHIGRVRPEHMLRPCVGPAWGYRHRARLSVRYVAKKGGVLVGFHERRSSYVADIRQCPVLPERVGRKIVALRELVATLTIRERLPQIEVAVAGDGSDARVILVLRVLDPPSERDRDVLAVFERQHDVEFWLQPGGPDTARPMHADAEPELLLSLREHDVAIPFGPTDFTQVNHQVNEVLVARALRLLRPRATDTVVDFFCGLGNFTLPLARRARRVVGIEGSAALVQRAQAAARRHGLEQRACFQQRDLFAIAAEDWGALVDQHGVIGLGLIDPPREGALAIARTLVAAGVAAPRRLVYVSCNPATLARDCAVLHHEGGWALRAAGVVNMFPHTSHVESITMLEQAA